MPDLKLIRKLFALGLLAILYSCNLSYANASVNENRVAPPSTKRTNTLIEDRTAKPLTGAPAKNIIPSNKKKALPVKSSATAGNRCACSCPSATSRTAATPGPWWDCVRGCLRSWGVSPVQIILCGGVCSTGVIPLCALCVGVDVTLFMLCSIGCDIYADHFPNDDGGHVPILTRMTHRTKKRVGERRTLALAALK